MSSSSDNEQINKKIIELKTFLIPFVLEEINKDISISTDFNKELSKEEITFLAIKYHSEGKISKAVKYYKLFINKGFIDSQIFCNYAILLQKSGKLKEAELLQGKAIKHNPDYAIAHYNLGNILKCLGKLKEAELSTRKAIHLQPDFAEAYSNLAIILKYFGNLKEAEISVRKAIELKPDFAEAYLNLSNILRDLGNLEKSEISNRKAIELKPDFADSYSNLGTILKDLGNLNEAELYTRKAIELNPDFAEAYSNLGTILKDLGNLNEAELSTRKAIELKPDFAEAYNNLGDILKNLGKLKEAELSFLKSIEIKPNFYDAFFNLSLIKLSYGDYESGLKYYEYRLKKKKPTISLENILIKPFTNENLDKLEKILVFSEQGLGDTLQFMRYIPYLRNQGYNIIFCAQEKLHNLIQSSNIDSNPLTIKQANNLSEGQWISLLSIPRFLKINRKNPIISQPYINSTEELNIKWKKILSKEKLPIVGINWQGNKKMERSYQGRSIPLEKFSIIPERNEIKMLSLQKGFGSEQLDNCSFLNKFVECQTQINSIWDFHENAAIIESCDLIITNDTAIAHLAGGIGKKVWLMLKDIPDWRWGLNGEKTFWYPSMRLFRQKERNNWNEVLERVSNEMTVELSEGIKGF